MMEYFSSYYFSQDVSTVEKTLLLVEKYFHPVLILCHDCLESRKQFAILSQKYHHTMQHQRSFDSWMRSLAEAREKDGRRIELLLSFENQPVYAQLFSQMLRTWVYTEFVNNALEQIFRSLEQIEKIETYVIDDAKMKFPAYVSYDVACRDKKGLRGELDAVGYMKERVQNKGLQYFLEKPREEW